MDIGSCWGCCVCVSFLDCILYHIKHSINRGTVVCISQRNKMYNISILILQALNLCTISFCLHGKLRSVILTTTVVDQKTAAEELVSEHETSIVRYYYF